MDIIDRLLIDLLKRHEKGINAKGLREGMEQLGHSVSQPTLSRRLKSLQAKRHVVARLAGRSTLYFRDPYHDWFSLPPTRRPRVSYDFGILSDYVSNQTQWLSHEDKSRLAGAQNPERLEASTYSRAIAQKLMVDLSFASSALEGNTYSYLDTQVLIEFGQAAEGKTAEETQMILNHKDAVTYLVDHINEIEVSTREIRTLHALLSRGLINPEAEGGVRARPVDIGGSAYIPLAVPQQLTDELEHLAHTAGEIRDPFEQSFFLMVMLSYLQAFEDVNKRTGRLACNIPLLKHGLAPLSFMEMNKAHYVEGLLSFYELHRIDLIREAYVGCYLSSVVRYEAYKGRDKGDLQIELHRRRDIQQCLQLYVRDSIESGRRLDASHYAAKHFSQEPESLKVKLIKRVGEVARSLNDANHVAYGIARQDFSDFESLPLRSSKEDGPSL